MNTERVYVKVNSDFDSVGYMQPRFITWTDGRRFKIESVKDFRPAGQNRESKTCDCYTVIINGVQKFLYFERASSHQRSSIGRWFVECCSEN